MVSYDALQVLGDVFECQVVGAGRYRLALGPEDVLYGDTVIAEDLQMVSDQVSALAGGACNEHCPACVGLLGHLVGRSGVALLTGEGDHEHWFIDFKRANLLALTDSISPIALLVEQHSRSGQCTAQHGP